MGRKKKEKYKKSLHQQAYEKLVSMQAFNESKKAAMEDGSYDKKIFSFNTYQTYWKHVKYFISWLDENYPNVTTLKKARRYVNEWLQSRVDEGLSSWTIQTEAKAVGKLFGIKQDDPDYFVPPKRNRSDIKRSRGDRVRDKHFSVTNNDELIKFCRGTGLRRSELEKLKGGHWAHINQVKTEYNRLKNKENLTIKEEKRLKMVEDALMFSNVEYFCYVINGKGGRSRLAPIIGPHKNQIIERIRNTKTEDNVWKHVNSNADIHGYRAEYATILYKKIARKINDIPYDKIHKGTGKRYQSEVYHCRKDEKGKKLDKKAMLIASKALGHNRIEIIANNYLRGL